MKKVLYIATLIALFVAIWIGMACLATLLFDKPGTFIMCAMVIIVFGLFKWLKKFVTLIFYKNEKEEEQT